MTRRDGPEQADSQLMATPLPPPGAIALDQAFELTNLHALRAAVAAHGTALGLPDDRLGGLVVTANELVTNAISHGGGAGRLRLWRTEDVLYCQVGDDGPGIADRDEAGTRPVPPDSEGGRGLWIVRQLCDEIHISTGAGGTVVTAAIHDGPS